MRLGMNIKIDVNKIEKDRLFKGKKGTYLSLTTFVDTEEKDEYDNNGLIAQETSQEEREQGVKTPILGNVRVFYSGDSNKHETDAKAGGPDITEEEIPF